MSKKPVLDFPRSNKPNANELMRKGLEHGVKRQCTRCGCPFFEMAASVKQVSGLFSPTGKDILAVYENVLVCKACLKPLSPDDLPEMPKKKCDDDVGPEAEKGESKDGN